MAVLTPTELTEVRQAVASGAATVTWTKPQINAAVQAIEDWFEANRVALGAAIETAVPGLLTTPQKRALVTLWIGQKFRRGG